ncbi:MAG: CRISPR-associated endonuclease Cas2 [Spirochaetota bacterium]
MKTLVIFDIPDDKIRNKIGEACKDYGLQRIQYSAFLGDINHNRRDELRQRLRRTLGRKKGNIQIYPFCDKDLKLRSEIINQGSKEEEAE